MKQISILITLATLILTSCSGGFSKGVKKDIGTGLIATYNGFSVDDVYIVIDGKKALNNKVPLGKKLYIEAAGVDFYEVVDGKVFPGCSIILTDKAGKELLNLPDAFTDLNEGVNAKDATMLDASLNTGEPMEVGQTYTLKVRFYDKKKKENEIVTQVELVMI